MIICPNCSATNPDDAQVCLSCGAPLVEGAGLPASQPVPAAEDEIPEPSPFVTSEPVISETVTPEPPEPIDANLPVAHVTMNDLIRSSAVDSASTKKDRSLAIILEVVPGLFGFLGFGWIYSGFTGAGIAWLVGFLLWNLIALVICVFTAGIGCLCTLPINLVVLIASVIALNSQIQKHSEQFKT